MWNVWPKTLKMHKIDQFAIFRKCALNLVLARINIFGKDSYFLKKGFEAVTQLNC